MGDTVMVAVGVGEVADFGVDRMPACADKCAPYRQGRQRRPNPQRVREFAARQPP